MEFFLKKPPSKDKLENSLAESADLLEHAKEYLKNKKQNLKDLDEEIKEQAKRLKKLSEKTDTASVVERINLEKEYKFNKNTLRESLIEDIERAKRSIRISEEKIAKYRKDLGLDN